MRTFLPVFALCLLPALALAEPLRLQGYVEGDYVRVAPTGAGTLAKVMVREGDTVAEAAPLFALDTVIELAARDQAQADLDRAEAQLADLHKGKRPDELKSIAEQKAQADAALRLSEVTLTRQDVLARNDYASRARLDEARAALDRDRAQVRRLEAEYRTALLGARPDEIAAQEALVGQKRLELAKADKRLADLAPKAPAESLVEKVYYRVGEFVAAGQPVVSLLPPGNVKLVFFLPEPRLGALKPGDRVSYTCDRCAPGEARVSFISTQAEYTPPVIYSVESRDKLVFRVEARGGAPLALNPGQPVDIVVPEK
ncbi:putative Co/Zn/Cd efflux system membrane fusion protein [Paramagnetospirillum magnetotacticum MS-1]|uniref:Putative Co/Zn/Cd efflux system membrane fusion protein n=1 Tax=Paramagnetospirillum magnetotacticum MS-1 TaxID=272627 RepID=A0A0C2UXX2_PARME|nr:HlyD family efflux transporter periplasmic adaptor subunit [Paramagnetospirillum magnetotacticum]KIL97656.1 putative Co/Zn/Cd efflux system membrane fusion protein [Paramagnetospirillum magnetotacticum MS-1]